MAAAVVVLVFLGIQQAPAYYDPGVQRLVNRDPVMELGHFGLHYRHSVQMGVSNPNLYTFVRNSPNELTDAFGRTENPCPANGQACNGCGYGTDVTS
jgi:hypothetical protein